MKPTPRTDAALVAMVELGGEADISLMPLVSLARALEGEARDLMALAQQLRDGLALALDTSDATWTRVEQMAMSVALGACARLRDLEQREPRHEEPTE